MGGKSQVNSHYRHPSPRVLQAMVFDKEVSSDQDDILGRIATHTCKKVDKYLLFTN